MRLGRHGIPQYKSLFRSVDLNKTDQLEYMAPEIPIIVSISVKLRAGHVNRILLFKVITVQHSYQFQNSVVLIPLYWAGARAM